ncbi:PPC domain-containing DNA-binding protein [Reyranella massiliensis]|uniref:PPC domain-containing DNA-binding protein n=1 Tax=Reyranella massiliensis TaxID=445220 RepID=UPI0002FC4A99|nr:PPC domain-containing DNA-binding protein [Reyranella massiliensis]
MQSKLVFEEAGERTFVLVLAAGEEAFAAISDFAARESLSAASLTAIGAFERATLGWFDLANKTYKPIHIESQCEGLSLLGDIAVADDGKPSLHMHAVMGLSDGTTRGGHFLKGVVRPTLEVTINETPARLRRRQRPELGLALIDLS